MIGFIYNHTHGETAFNLNQKRYNYMKRLALNDLQNWRYSSTRKSLLIRGARQVGKTHAVRELGKSFENFVEINPTKLSFVA